MNPVIEPQAQPKQRVLWMDALNVIATFCVVWLHANNNVHSFANTTVWRLHLIPEVLGFWAVPVFFMLSGAKLMGYRARYNTKTFLKKRFMATMIPFLIWSFLAFIRNLADGQYAGQNLPDLVKTFCNGILGNELEYIFWFFIPLFAVYACMPVLSLLKAYRRVLWYMAGLFVITCTVLPLALQWMDLQWNDFLRFPMTYGYVGFAILGYLLSTQELDRVKRIGIYFLGFAGGIVFRTGYVLITSVQQGKVNRDLFEYLTFPVVLLGAAVFVWCKQVRWERIFQSERSVRFLAQVSACGLGVYLLHRFVLNLLWKLSGNVLKQPEWCTLVALGVYPLCVVAIWCARRTKVGRVIVS